MPTGSGGIKNLFKDKTPTGISVDSGRGSGLRPTVDSKGSNLITTSSGDKFALNDPTMFEKVDFTQQLAKAASNNQKDTGILKTIKDFALDNKLLTGLAVGSLGASALMGNMEPEEIQDLQRGEGLDIEGIRAEVIEAYKDPSGEKLKVLSAKYPFLSKRKNIDVDKLAYGGRIGRAEGGIMDLDGKEKDYRNTGGFVDLGAKEKADDVPARLSVNEFVFTADAVRNAGGGDIDQGAEVMENMMKHLEQGGQVSEESESRQLPPQYVEDLQKDYGEQLTARTAADLDTSLFAPKVAGQDAAQTSAYNLATTQGQGIGAFSPYITQAGAYSGPQGYQGFMSPYQQDVINATLSEYDTQAAAGLTGIGQQAAMSGNLGGGREGVMRAQYQNKSDMNRALLQSGLLQQGFTQANQLANQAFGQQQALAQQVPQLYGADINTLRSAGAGQQAQAQAQLDATREANRLEAYEPYERLGYLGSGIASIASGAPGQYQSMVTPNPTPLQTALGIASVGGGLLGNYGDYLRGSGQQ